MLHECAGTGCGFCRWRQAHPIELGWEKLLECPSETDTDLSDFALSTQQTFDFVADLDFDDFTSIDATVEGLLAEAEAEADVQPPSKSTTPPLPLPSVSQSRSGPSNRRYGSPKSDKAVSEVIATGIPAKTRQQTDWTVRVWEQWSTSRNEQLLPGEKPFSTDFGALTVEEMQFWLCRFVLEVRKVDGEHYCPSTLYQLCCGLLRHLRNNCNQVDVNIFEDREFYQFQSTLDAEMKRLNANGKYIEKRQAQSISIADEKYLWEQGLLGEHSPQALLDTMVYLTGLYFALRSGNEHRRLRHSPSQLQLVEPPNDRSYIIYREDVSKTNQGGLNSRRKKPKEVVHYANITYPEKCFVHLYKVYTPRCPVDRPANAFYLKPLSKPKSQVWYSKVALGHNALQQTVPRLMKNAGYTGYYTNHSLRVSAASRLYDSGVDEQAIMSVTGHSSTDGVRCYKSMSEKLKELTSDVLNQTDVAVPVTQAKKRKTGDGGKENLPITVPPRFYDGGKASKTTGDPVFQISGGANITINIGCPQH